MQISGLNTSFSSYSPPKTSDFKAANPQFGNLLAASTQQYVSTSDTQNSQKTGSNSGLKKPDFSNMTAAEFGAEASAMFKRGEIDFDTMSSMVLRSDSIARMDAESGISRNHDFVEIFKGYMNFLEKSGSRNDPTSGYGTLQNVMNLIK